MAIRPNTSPKAKQKKKLRTYLGIGAGGAIIMAFLLWGLWGTEEQQAPLRAENASQQLATTKATSKFEAQENTEIAEVLDNATAFGQESSPKQRTRQATTNKPYDSQISRKTLAPQKTKDITHIQSVASWGIVDFKFAEEGGQLSWNLDVMEHADEFTVETSLDNKIFRSIGSQKATTALKYAFEDKEIAFVGMPRIYYRLKMKGLDNKTSYSPTKMVEMPLELGLYGFVELQNNQIGCFYAADKAEQVDIRIENPDKKVVHQSKVAANRDTQSKWVQPQDWEPGTYTLWLSNAETEFKVDFEW